MTVSAVIATVTAILLAALRHAHEQARGGLPGRRARRRRRDCYGTVR